jgi:translation initiation factor IF-2
LQTKGYGSITSRSKGHSKNAAKADNQFDAVQEKLQWQGQDKEQESASSEDASCLLKKEVVTIKGQFDAQQDLSEAMAAKQAQSAKSATCLRRESKQHMNELCSKGMPGPLEGAEGAYFACGGC